MTPGWGPTRRERASAGRKTMSAVIWPRCPTSRSGGNERECSLPADQTRDHALTEFGRRKVQWLRCENALPVVHSSHAAARVRDFLGHRARGQHGMLEPSAELLVRSLGSPGQRCSFHLAHVKRASSNAGLRRCRRKSAEPRRTDRCRSHPPESERRRRSRSAR